MKNSLLFVLTIITLLITSCEKEEGVGGTATIVGKVWVQDYTADLSFLKAEYWGEEVDVYIIYGNDSIYSDRARTNYDGSYWFQYLNEGTYTIYAYSNDNSITPSPSGRVPVKVTVSVDKGKVVTAPQITIID